VAKLFLKFDAAVLKEFTLAQDVVTIGRLLDNIVQIDNLAVSGHHAKVYWDQDHYVIEDTNSLNGTYLNNRRISKAPLKDQDVILIGKHTITFSSRWAEGLPAGATQPKTAKVDATAGIKMEKATPTPTTSPVPAEEPATQAESQDRVGIVQVVDGKTDQKSYSLASKMTVIGKSELASIRLKGFFAPDMAALINRKERKYFIAASEPKIKVKVNGQEIAGQEELNEGDIVEVAGVKMTFGFQE
jgi:pSer/pThr/pTyr-binding forkhead associated (FHA) protein